MRPGKRRHQIKIQNLTLTRNTTSGEMKKSWSSFSTDIWAGIEYLKGTEYFGGSRLPQELSQKHLIFTTPYSTGIEETMRVVYGANNYDIIAIEDPNERHIELKILGELVE